MKNQFFSVISLIFLFFAVHSQCAQALMQDSVQSILQKKLSNKSFKEEYEVIDYLDITSKLYFQSPTDALFYLNALEEKLDSEGNSTGKAYIMGRKGSYYWLQGIYDASLKAYFEALDLFEKDGNISETIKILNNIGETYKKQHDYTQSAIFIKMALAKAGEAENLPSELILVNLGQLFMLKEKYDSANYYLNLTLNRDSLSIKSRAFTYLYKGIINHKTGQYDSAQYFFERSLPLWADLDYGRGTVESKLEIARNHLSQNNFSEANTHLKEAEEIALKINTQDLLLKIYQSKIDLFKYKGSKDSLIFYFDKYLEINDSIFNSESRAEINKLSIQYNLAQKEKEGYKLALEQAELSNKIESRTQFLILVLVVLLCSIAFIFYLRNKSTQLKNAHLKLQQQKEEIEDKQNKITSKSLALAKVNQELHSLNNNLEQRVIDRTKKLNERNKLISDFTYFNSHKLRAPVANVLGLINVMELTKEGQIDPIVLNHLKTSAMELDQVIFNLKNLLDLDDETED